MTVGTREPVHDGDGDDGGAGEQHDPHDDHQGLERPHPLLPFAGNGCLAIEQAFTTTADDQGQRIDRLIALRLGHLSRSRVKSLIEGGHIRLDGATIANPSAKVKPGQMITVTVPPVIEGIPAAQSIPLEIVYEDDQVLVIDKPAGLVVHPAPGNPDATLVNAVLAHCGDTLQGIGGVRRPGIVHRLDKETSGLMVVAKTAHAHALLSAAFAERTIERAYQAVVWGVPSPRDGVIDRPIGRHPTNRQKMAVVAAGKPAVTAYRTIRPLGILASLIECRLKTGRTHQIRVHMTDIGHSLVGDPVYGRTPGSVRRREEPWAIALAGFPRQALHAYLLGFAHPTRGQMMRFESRLPQDIATLLSSLE
jgi:23S rRNA pseudouridine1911/1915/1917 synthase